MGELLRRRDFIQQTGVSPTGPMFQLKQGQSSFASRCITITGNHIYDNCNGASSSRHAYVTPTTVGNTAPTEVWFTLHAGDTVVYKVTNISYVNRYAAGSSTSTIRLKDTGNVTIDGGFSLSLPIGSSGTMDNREETTVIGTETNVSSVYLYSQRDSTLEYDLEIWINGIRYI